jgi:hypothetical protein
MEGWRRENHVEDLSYTYLVTKANVVTPIVSALCTLVPDITKGVQSILDNILRRRLQEMFSRLSRLSR